MCFWKVKSLMVLVSLSVFEGQSIKLQTILKLTNAFRALIERDSTLSCACRLESVVIS